MNVAGVCAHWVALHESLGVGTPIQDEPQYQQALATPSDCISGTV